LLALIGHLARGWCALRPAPANGCADLPRAAGGRLSKDDEVMHAVSCERRKRGADARRGSTLLVGTSRRDL
jgi:hypothetical protein